MLKSISDKSLFRLFDSALDAVVGMDRNGYVIAWNAHAETLFGWTTAEAVGQVLGDLIVPVHLRSAHAEGLERYLKTGTGPVINRRIEIEAVNRQGIKFPVELTVVPVSDEGEERFFAFLRDITARREHEERLRQRALEAEVLWEASERVAAGGTIEELLAACLQKICQISGWPVGHVYLPDSIHEPTKLLPSSSWHFEHDELKPIALETERFEFNRGEGLPGQIWAARNPVWIPDIAEANDLPRRDILLKRGLHAAFGFPVHSQGRLEAVLEFFSTAKRAPDQHLLYVIQSVGQQLGRVLERQRAQEAQELLVRELSHRVGNTLAVLQSVFRMSARHAGSVEELREAFEARMGNIAEAHRLLAARDWQSADLEDIVNSALAPYCASSPDSCHVSGPMVPLPSPAVLSLTMVFHELATNAAKYGAFSSSGGKLDVIWQIVKDPGDTRALELKWTERNATAAQTGSGGGYGTTLIDTSVRRLLGGEIQRVFSEDGLQIKINMPLR